MQYYELDAEVGSGWSQRGPGTAKHATRARCAAQAEPQLRSSEGVLQRTSSLLAAS